MPPLPRAPSSKTHGAWPGKVRKEKSQEQKSPATIGPGAVFCAVDAIEPAGAQRQRASLPWWVVGPVAGALASSRWLPGPCKRLFRRMWPRYRAASSTASSLGRWARTPHSLCQMLTSAYDKSSQPNCGFGSLFVNDCLGAIEIRAPNCARSVSVCCVGCNAG